MNEIRHLSETHAQIVCEEIGVLEPVFIDTPYADGTCFGATYLAGLCSRCREPIGYHLTNGGKLKPSKTLRLSHLYSGDIRCQSDTILAKIKPLNGQQKSEFFTALHDEQILRETGLSEDEIKKRLLKLKEKQLPVVKG